MTLISPRLSELLIRKCDDDDDGDREEREKENEYKQIYREANEA